MLRVILPILLLTGSLSLGRLTGAEKPPVLPLRTNDVIAFIGGANMVALAQNGHLETLLTLRHPHHKLRFRSLAWEGDTVFAQPRDVNYPDLVTQLKQVGATVAFVRFGQMESLAGEAGLTNFVTAFETLLSGISATCSRVVLICPAFDKPWRGKPARLSQRDAQISLYAEAVRNLAKGRHPSTATLTELLHSRWVVDTATGKARYSIAGLDALEVVPEEHLLAGDARLLEFFPMPIADLGLRQDLLTAIFDKNRLWNDYSRPSNWAFLAGDRTEQTFSRDYRDRNIRAFAQEMQQFLPLIADAEKRIDELAAKAAAAEEATR